MSKIIPKYSSCAVVRGPFNETTLVINLASNEGKELTEIELGWLLYSNNITCVAFNKADKFIEPILELTKSAKENFQVKVAVYLDSLKKAKYIENNLPYFDYIECELKPKQKNSTNEDKSN